MTLDINKWYEEFKTMPHFHALKFYNQHIDLGVDLDELTSAAYLGITNGLSNYKQDESLKEVDRGRLAVHLTVCIRQHIMKSLNKHMLNCKAKRSEIAWMEAKSEIKWYLGSEDRPEIVQTDPNDSFLQAENSELIVNLIRGLTEKELEIIKRHYWNKEFLASIARDLGVSRMRISQIKDKALSKMRSMEMISEFL